MMLTNYQDSELEVDSSAPYELGDDDNPDRQPEGNLMRDPEPESHS